MREFAEWLLGGLLGGGGALIMLLALGDSTLEGNSRYLLFVALVLSFLLMGGLVCLFILVLPA